MKKYLKEAVIFALQLFSFYLLPLFFGAVGPFGIITLMIILTLILSSLAGVFCKEKTKYFYPLATAVCFIPSVFIYYNESALIHSLWYFCVSALGLLIGAASKRIGK